MAGGSHDRFLGSNISARCTTLRGFSIGGVTNTTGRDGFGYEYNRWESRNGKAGETTEQFQALIFSPEIKVQK